MTRVTSNVFPVFDLLFKIGIKGVDSTDAEMMPVKDMTSFSLSIEGNTQKWNPLDMKGWGRALMTGKAATISLNGKRHVGDPGNDYVASIAFKDGLDCTTKGEVEFPDGSKLKYNCVLDVKDFLGGESQDVAPLSFDMIVDGKPEYIEAPASDTPGSETTEDNTGQGE